MKRKAIIAIPASLAMLLVVAVGIARITVWLYYSRSWVLLMIGFISCACIALLSATEKKQ